MNKKIGRVSATVMGLIAGIIHGIGGIILSLFILLTGGLTSSFFGNVFGNFSYAIGGIVIVVGIVIFVIALLNLIGGCIVRSSRIAGGVLMIITAIPIIVMSLSAVWMTWWLLITGLLSFTAAILAFIPYSDRYKQIYIERKQKKFNQQHQAYQQPYQPQQQPVPSGIMILLFFNTTADISASDTSISASDTLVKINMQKKQTSRYLQVCSNVYIPRLYHCFSQLLVEPDHLL